MSGLAAVSAADQSLTVPAVGNGSSPLYVSAVYMRQLTSGDPVIQWHLAQLQVGIGVSDATRVQLTAAWQVVYCSVYGSIGSQARYTTIQGTYSAIAFEPVTVPVAPGQRPPTYSFPEPSADEKVSRCFYETPRKRFLRILFG